MILGIIDMQSLSTNAQNMSDIAHVKSPVDHHIILFYRHKCVCSPGLQVVHTETQESKRDHKNNQRGTLVHRGGKVQQHRIKSPHCLETHEAA